jgi:prophage regulatory protein
MSDAIHPPNTSSGAADAAALTFRAQLPLEGYVRLDVILRTIPVGRSTWWAGVKSGRFPTGVKIGPRMTAWRVGDIRALMDRIGQGDGKVWGPR